MKAVALAELTSVVHTWSPSRFSGEFNYIDLSSVDQTTKQILGASRLSADDAPSRARQLVTTGDVLVSTVRPKLNGVASVPFELDGATASTGFCVLRPRAGLLDGRYLFHWVCTGEFVEAMSKRSIGASYPAVSDKIVKASNIPLPPIEEQRRLAAILDKANELRAKRRAAVAQLNTLTEAIFVEMFGDPREWSRPTKETGRSVITTLGNISFIRTGKLDANAADTDGQYPFFTCSRETLRIRTPAFQGKAVLVAGNGDLNVKYWEGKFNAYQRTYVIQSRDETEVHPKFLHRFLALYVSRLRELAIGGVIKYIKLPYLTEAIVRLPTYQEQLEFVQRAQAVEGLQVQCDHGRRTMDHAFRSLEQRAFSGAL